MLWNSVKTQFLPEKKTVIIIRLNEIMSVAEFFILILFGAVPVLIFSLAFIGGVITGRR
ncbi:hypothetical protein AB38_1540 [Escherichia coli 1-110-08_S1_C2]|nr:hypothetical protein AB38_1540 [Escherichia coli 1-110-08_S1_C2]